MDSKRWALVIISIIMVVLVYSFLSKVFKSDNKKVVHTRMYRDYSSYGKRKHSSDDDDYSGSSKVYSSSAEARKLKRTMFNNAVAVTVTSYNDFMKAATKNMPDPDLPKPNGNPQYQEVMKLAAKPLPQLQSGLMLYTKGEYEEALSKFDDALQSLDPMEMKNRIQLLSMIAECYLKLKNDDGYIQNKIRQIRIERKYKKLLEETFTDLRGKYGTEFMSTSEATKNLLRIKTVAANQDNPMTREMLKRAELDLEVARKVSN